MKRVICLFIALALVFAMCPQIQTTSNAYAADDSERSFENEHYFQTLGNGGELYMCMSYGSSEAVVFTITGISKEEYTIQEKIEDGVSGVTRNIVGIVSVAELNGNEDYEEEPFGFTSNSEYLKITKLNIPDSIRFIGKGAFYGFEYLKTVTFGSGLTVEEEAFANCTSLESISFPEGSNVSDLALLGCTGLKSIENAPSYVDIGSVNKEPQLQKVSFMKGLEEVGGVLVDISQGEGAEGKSTIDSLSTVVIPDGVKRICDGAFSGYTGLTTVNFPSSIEEIGEYAFRECSALIGSVALNNLKSVGTHAFLGCKNLKLAVAHPGEYTEQQYRSSGITSLTFGKDAEYIWPSGLYDLRNLNNITVQTGNPTYKSENGVLFTKEDGYWKLVKYPAAKSGTSYTVPSWVEEIGAYAFDSCSLKEIHLPEDVNLEEKSGEEYFGEFETPRDGFTNMLTKPDVYVVKGGNADQFISHSDPRFTIKYESNPTPSTPSTPSTPTTPSTPSTPSTPTTPSTPSTPSTGDDKTVSTDDKNKSNGQVEQDEEETYEMLALAEYLKTEDGTEWTKGGCKYKILKNYKHDPDKYKVDLDKLEVSYNELGPGTVALLKAKNTKSVKIPATVKLNNHTFKVVQINANAFKGKKIRTVSLGKNVKVIKKNAFRNSKATKVILRTKLLKKSKVKNCLKGSKVKTVQVKVGNKSMNKKYVKKYKKYFIKKNAGRKVTVK